MVKKRTSKLALPRAREEEEDRPSTKMNKKVKEDDAEVDDDDDDVQIFSKSSHTTTTTSTTTSTPLAKPVEPKPNHPSFADTFTALGLDDWICANLSRVAISRPTPVQVACIPPILAGMARVLSASAPTGSGKTAAFALPILDSLARDPYGVFALVLTPTRELAIQIAEQFSTLGAPINCRCEVIIGGMPVVEQQLALAKCPHVVVATPGRMATHVLGADPPKLDRLRFLVLDESDRLLAKGEGFEKDLVRISQKLTHTRKLQTLLFSATSGGLKDVATAHQLGLTSANKPDFIWDYSTFAAAAADSASQTNMVKLVPSTLTQTLSLVPVQAKHAYMAWFMKTFAPKKLIEKSKLVQISLKKEKPDTEDRAKSMIMFTSTCEQCQLYCETLNQLDVPCVAIHAELQQKQRLDNLNKFRSGQVAILIATDVASRGLDIPQVDVVLNLDVPREPENYLHRIGRCARAGRLGRSFLFVTQNEVDLVKAIEEYMGGTAKELAVFEMDDDEVAQVLHKASVAKRKAVMKLHDDGFLDRIQVRKDRRKGKRVASGENTGADE